MVAEMAQQDYLRSGELAERCRISSDTLRHYERMKLLATPRRSAGNYGLYPPEALARVHLIQRALSVGFSLSELAGLLKVRDAGGTPCRKAKQMLEDKLGNLEQQMITMTALRKHIRGVLADWDRRLTDAPDGKPARLLENLEIFASGVRDHALRRRPK